MEEKARFIEYLKEQGQKLTAQRLIILNLFLKTEKHLAAEDLYVLSKTEDPKIGYATVHRTLKLLKEAGIAREVDLGDGRKRYEHLLGHKHHDHLICVKCGKVIEVLSDKIEKLQEALAGKHGFAPLSHRMEIFGACKKCR